MGCYLGRYSEIHNNLDLWGFLSFSCFILEIKMMSEGLRNIHTYLKIPIKVIILKKSAKSQIPLQSMLVKWKLELMIIQVNHLSWYQKMLFNLPKKGVNQHPYSAIMLIKYICDQHGKITPRVQCQHTYLDGTQCSLDELETSNRRDNFQDIGNLAYYSVSVNPCLFRENLWPLIY